MILETIGLATAAYGALSGGDAEDAAKRQMRLNRMQAEILKGQAKQEEASGQRSAILDRHTAELIASRALAVSAAGGGGTTDPTVAKVIGDINSEGAYRAAVSLYQGEAEARKLRDQAHLLVESGQAMLEGAQDQDSASRLSSIGSLLEMGTSMYDKYWPKSSVTSSAGAGVISGASKLFT